MSASVVITRTGSAALVVGCLLSAYLIWLVADGQPVGIGGPDIHGDLLFLTIALFGLGTFALATHPTRWLARNLTRKSLLVTSMGSLALVLEGIRGSQVGVHADADLAAVTLFITGLLALVTGVTLVGIALVRDSGTGRACGAVILSAVGIRVVAIGAPGNAEISMAAYVVLVAGFGCLGAWSFKSSFHDGPSGEPNAGRSTTPSAR